MSIRKATGRRRRRDGRPDGLVHPIPPNKRGTDEDRRPRESLEERYGTYEEYERRFRESCADYVKRGYLLQEDAERLISRLGPVKEMFAK